MSSRETFIRQRLIYLMLHKKPSSFKEINDYLYNQSLLQQYNLNVSKRTFQRDLNDIRSVYNVDILYNKENNTYSIELPEQTSQQERITEAIDIYHAFTISQNINGMVQFEKRKSQGTENIFGLLHAIKNKVLISFLYQSFKAQSKSIRLAAPCALKEFKNRWYIVAKDSKDDKIKTFALDRLSHLEITTKKFTLPGSFNLEQYFKHCFGIINPENEMPQIVVLSFSPEQANYIKTLPLHESQEILQDNEEACIVKLCIYITHDFIMELLSLGDNVIVLQPETLAKDLASTHKAALKNYLD